MKSKEIATLMFKDANTGENSVAIVRLTDNAIGVCLSLENNGDIEVMFTVEEANKLSNALEMAIEEISAINTKK